MLPKPLKATERKNFVDFNTSGEKRSPNGEIIHVRASKAGIIIITTIIKRSELEQQDAVRKKN